MMVVGNLNRTQKCETIFYYSSLFGMLDSTIGFSQEINIKIEIKDSLESKILNKKRQLFVNLPKDYETSNLTVLPNNLIYKSDTLFICSFFSTYSLI